MTRKNSNGNLVFSDADRGVRDWLLTEPVDDEDEARRRKHIERLTAELRVRRPQVAAREPYEIPLVQRVGMERR